MKVCPECGTRMGGGYNPEDVCSDCYEINSAADDILMVLDRLYPRVGIQPRIDARNVIKKEIRERFL